MKSCEIEVNLNTFFIKSFNLCSFLLIDVLFENGWKQIPFQKNLRTFLCKVRHALQV